ncbi:MAG TPA: MATE family efflux transporter [Gemmatimonadales bacterium]|jgi:putative MATE family efflux protein|nr:MATE family efflux transporter [Gemmatimonadales bacterium]
MNPELTSTLPARDTWWSVVKDAVRGVPHDYTAGSLNRAIILLAIPMVLEMAMESVFAVVDVFWVSHLGPDAVATVGLTESMLTLVYTAAMGLSIGVAAVVARRIGEKRPDAAAEAAVQGIALGLVVAASVAVLGVTLAPRLLALMGASPAVTAIGSGYTRTMLGGSATVLLLFLINAIFRGAGDAAIAMRVLWFANAINILLGPCLIFGLGPFPRLGVTGAAIATTIGRGSGVLYQLYRLRRGDARVTVRRPHIALRPALMAHLVRLSGSGTFQVLVGTASYIGIVRIISTFGSAALAGYTIAIRLVIFCLLPSWGLSNAAATMVGQSLGAKDPDRAERAVWIAGRYNMVVLGVVGLAFIALAQPIVGLFTQDAAAAPIGALALRTMSYGFVFYALGMVLTTAFNGAGDTWTPTWINLACFWLWEIPLAYVLARVLRLGPFGAFLAITIGYSSLALVSVLLFRRGRWKQRAV